MNPSAVLLFGFALGVRHATDPDHIAAIGTMLVDGEGGGMRRAAAIGGTWGIGHSATTMIVGGALVLFRLPMPVRVALVLEFGAALMLIALGVRSLVAQPRRGALSAIRPLAVGMVHGLAGSALLALLVLGTTSRAGAAAVYLVCFCAGTVAGMALITTLLSVPARLAGAGRSGRWGAGGSFPLARAQRAISVAAGVASVVIGLAMAHRIGVHDGLFAATPIQAAQ